MPIVEIKTVNRPDINVSFFDGSNAVAVQAKSDIGYELVEKTPTVFKFATPDGKVVSERTLSNNGLTQTAVTTFATLEDYSRVETIMGIEVDCEYQQYAESVGLTHSGDQYMQSGIDQPFTCTTTYTYTPETSTLYELFDYFVNIVESSYNLSSLVNTGSQIIAIHEYQNSEDFTQNHWRDFEFISQLNTGGVTRTIKYELL